jgi:Fic family protein
MAAGTYAKKIYNRLLIDLSYNSSRLEGNTYSWIETERLLLEGISSEHKLDEERVMILNHKEAIRFLVDQAQKISPSVASIKTLHYLLSDGLVPPADSGQVRKNAVRISGTTYSPLESSKALETILGKISKTALKIINPFEQSLFLLTHLAYLQAFIDVNKRTSRLAANIPLIKGNCTPLSFNDVSKEDYLNAMISIYELTEPAPLAMLYVQSYLRTVAQYKTISESINFDEIRVRYRTERRALLREIILINPSAKKLALLIKTNAEKIPEAARSNFLEDLQEDLDSLGPHQLSGLGLNQKDLDSYLRDQTKQK